MSLLLPKVCSHAPSHSKRKPNVIHDPPAPKPQFFCGLIFCCPSLHPSIPAWAPQGLCTCCYCRLDSSFHLNSHGSFPLFFQVLRSNATFSTGPSSTTLFKIANSSFLHLTLAPFLLYFSPSYLSQLTFYCSLIG